MFRFSFVRLVTAALVIFPFVAPAQAMTLSVGALSTVSGNSDLLYDLKTTKPEASLPHGNNGETGKNVELKAVGSLMLRYAAIVDAGDHTGNTSFNSKDPNAAEGGHYLAVYRNPSNSADDATTLSFKKRADVHSVSFDWGSIDSWNKLGVQTSDGNTQYYTYTDLENAAAGTSYSFTDSNLGTVGRRVTITASALITKLIFMSLGQDAFEVRNLTVSPVPLPAAALLLGTGLAGLGMLRRKKESPKR